MSLYYKPFNQSRPPMQKGASFHPMDFHFIVVNTTIHLATSLSKEESINDYQPGGTFIGALGSS